MKKFLLLTLLISMGLSACAQVSQAAPGQVTDATATPLPPVKASDEIIAEAHLVPLESVTLSFMTSGIVSELYFEEGDLIKAGDTVAQLGNQEQLMATIAGAELELLNAEQALDDLKEGGPLAIAQAQLDVATALKEVEDAEKHRNSLSPGNRASAETIDNERVRLNDAKEVYDSAQAYYDSLSELSADDPERHNAYVNMTQARSAYWTILARYNWYTGEPSDTEQAMLDAEVAMAETRLAEAQKRQEGLENGIDPDDIALAEARIVNAEAQLSAAQAALDNLKLTSPFTGTVLSLDLKVGQFVGASTPSVELVNFSGWKLETSDLTELNVVRIQPGNSVMIKFDALPEITFTGTVEEIKPQGHNVQGDIVYTVIITPKIDETWKTWQEQLYWNMTAAVTITPQEE